MQPLLNDVATGYILGRDSLCDMPNPNSMPYNVFVHTNLVEGYIYIYLQHATGINSVIHPTASLQPLLRKIAIHQVRAVKGWLV